MSAVNFLTCFTLVQRKYYLMVESRPVGFGCLFWFVVGLSVSFSPPSDCISFPSMMTWAPCPHGIRTRGKKRAIWASGRSPCLIHAQWRGCRDCRRTRCLFFFHEYGRRVGMVPRSSLKGGKNSRMVEKITRTTTTTQKPQPKAHRPSLHHHVVFPLC